MQIIICKGELIPILMYGSHYWVFRIRQTRSLIVVQIGVGEYILLLEECMISIVVFRKCMVNV